MSQTHKELATIALTGVNGQNLCCDQNNACAFNRSWIQAWEKFQVVGLPDGRVALRSWKNLYLHAAADQYHVWFCASAIGENETFDLVFSGNKMGILTSFGKYLTCEMDGKIPWLVCRAGHFWAWEQFDVTVLSGSFQDLVCYKRDLESQKNRDEEMRRLREERAAMERRLQQQIDYEREAHRVEQERQKKEEKQRRREDAKMRVQILDQSLKQNEREMAEIQRRLNEEEIKLDLINERLVEETNARSRFEPPDAGGCVKIVLMGNTGDGKSTLANRLAGDVSPHGDEGPFATSRGRRSLHSHTEKIQAEFVDTVGKRFCIVDTPGADDSRGRDRIHQINLVDFLYGIGEVHAFVLVWNFTVQRLGMHAQVMLREMNRTLGDALWRNFLIVVTRVDNQNNMEELDQFQRELPNEIGDLFGLSHVLVSQIRVVGIGENTFALQRDRIFRSVVACNDGTPFVSQDLVAPVEERQAEFDEQSAVCSGLVAKLSALLDERSSLNAQKQTTEALVQQLA